MMGSTAVSDAASRGSHDVARWVPPLARAGYAAKGVVYIAIAWLSATAAFGGAGASGSRSAIAVMAANGGGAVVLWLIGLGLVGYVVWRLVQALVDPEDEGGGKRIVYLVSAMLYAGLAFWTVRAALKGYASSSDGGSSGWTATLMSQPMGRWLVFAAGVAVGGYGLVQFWNAYRAKVADRLKPGLPSGTRRWVVRCARAGLVARGVVMLVIGGLLGMAGWTSQPEESAGLGEAMETLRDQPYGPWLMAAVAVGLGLYGIYQLVQARYRRIGPLAGR